MANDLSIKIGVDANGAVEGLTVVTKGVDGAAQEMRRSLANIGQGAKDATPQFDSLSGALKEWRGHVRTEARYTTFLAQQIAGMGFASKGAAAEITGLISAFAFGGGFGVAVELAKMVGHAWAESGSEIKKATEEAAKALKELGDQVDDYLASSRKETEYQKLRRKIIEPLEKDEEGHRQKLKDLTDEQARAQAKADEARKGGDSAGKMVAEQRLFSLSKQVEKEEELSRMATIRRAAEEHRLEPVKKADEEKEDAEDEKREAAHQLRLLQIRSQGMIGLEKIYADFRVKKQEILNNEELTEEQTTREIVEAEKAMWREAVNFNIEQAKKVEQNAARHRNNVIRAEHEAAQAIAKFYKEKDEERLQEYDRLQKEIQKKLQEQSAVAEKIGDTFGKVFGGMISGTMSVGKAFAAMAQTIIHEIIQMAIIQIKANAGIAGAEAAASQAMIPGIGPILAIGALAAVEGAVLALLSLVPGAATGWDIPVGTNPLVQAHGGEAILPRPTTEGMNEFLESWRSGAVGGSTIQIQAFDSKSIEDFLRQPDASRALVRRVSQLRRDGRL